MPISSTSGAAGGYLVPPQMVRLRSRFKGGSFFSECARDPLGHCKPGSGSGSSSDKPANAPTPPGASEARAVSERLARMMPAERIAAAKKEEQQLRSEPPAKNEAKLIAGVEAMVKEGTGNPFRHFTVEDAYNKLGQGVTVRQFQAMLLRMQDAGKVRLSAYTQSIASHPHPEFLVPSQGELRFYLEKPPVKFESGFASKAIKASFFSECERDDEGHCKPGPGGHNTTGGAKPPKLDSKLPEKRRAQAGELVSARREGKGKDAKIVLGDGSAAPAHIKPAMIPPAWSDVQISMNPDADVLVSARDAKGRGKKVYNQKYADNNQAAKFAKIQEGLKKQKAIFDQNQQNRKSDDPKIRENADCTWLMQEQATRPGSDADTKGLAELYGKPMSEKNVQISKNKKGKESVALKFGDKTIPIRDEGTAKELMRRVRDKGDLEDSTFWLKSHGATTLESRHVVKTNDGVRLQFVGKEGVWHDHLIRDKNLAAMLMERKATPGGADSKLFGTDYAGVSDYAKTLDGGKFTPKDFRTMKATSMAIDEINRRGQCCKSPEDYKKSVMAVATKVSGVLGNRPEQALLSYISPAVWGQWKGAAA